MSAHRTPGHLSEGSQTWLSGLKDERDWTATEWRLLVLAAEAWDRAATSRRRYERDGMTLTAPILSKKGEVVGERVTAHPAVAVARDAAATFSKLVGQLGLDAAKPAVDLPDAPEEQPQEPGILLRLAERAS